MNRLLIATTNQGKLKEIKHFLADLPFEIIGLSDLDKEYDEPEETEETLMGNSVLKAKYYGEKTGLISLADDTGLFCHGLDNWPGVRAARVAKTDDERCLALLEKMNGIKDRSASFRSGISIYDPNTKSTFFTLGELHGEILTEMPGERKNGFCYDPLFFLKEFGKTTDELETVEKNAISHRGKALVKTKYFLQNQYSAKHIVVPIALIIQDGKILMHKRNDPHRPDYHGKWEFPGGTMEFGESFEENIIRETREEAGYDVEVIKKLDHTAVENQELPTFQYQVYLVPFLCKIIGGEGEYSDAEVMEQRWFELDDVVNHDLIGENRRMFEKLLSELKESI